MTFINDYPVTGGSFISQYYVMKLAREQGVTVLLDGQGSDEITGGYNHTFYRYYADLLRGFRWLKFAREFPQYARYNPKGSTAAKLAKTLFAALVKEPRIYREEAKRQLADFLTIRPASRDYLSEIRHIPGSRLSNFLYNLITRTMIQTLLHFEDRNSMGFSIESRVPFLDYRLVEFAFSLPGSYKIHGNYGKYIHREALKQIVPQEIANRKDKVSFTSPGEALWLKNELRPVVEEVLHSAAFRQRGVFDVAKTDAAWQEFLKGNDQQGKVIWRAVALEKWFRVMLDGVPDGY
jgi:asparagine synthase (glutamine-hydrolysing)